MNALAIALTGALTLVAAVGASTAQSTQATGTKTLELGNFSVSLAVKDIKASKAFYEKLDFKEVGGKIEQNWIVLQNGNARIGLFQGMFDKNIMTFNPGWTQDKEILKDFQDIRDLPANLEGARSHDGDRGGRDHRGTGVLRGLRSRRQYAPVRSARPEPEALARGIGILRRERIVLETMRGADRRRRGQAVSLRQGCGEEDGRRIRHDAAIALFRRNHEHLQL